MTESNNSPILVPANTTTQTLEPNKYYIFDSQLAEELTINFTAEDFEYLDEFKGEFKVDDQAVSIKFPEIVRWVANYSVTKEANRLTLAPKNTYLFSIANNLGLIKAIRNPKLAAPEVTLVDKMLTWNPVEFATSYAVYYTNILLAETTEPNLDLTPYIELYMKDLGEYPLNIFAKSNYYIDNVTQVPYYTSEALLLPTNTRIVMNSMGFFIYATPEDNTTQLTFTLDTEAPIECDVTGSSWPGYVAFDYPANFTFGEHNVTIKATNTLYPNIYLENEQSFTVTYIEPVRILNTDITELTFDTPITWEDDYANLGVTQYHINVNRGASGLGTYSTPTIKPVTLRELLNHLQYDGIMIPGENDTFSVFIYRTFNDSFIVEPSVYTYITTPNYYSFKWISTQE